MNARPSGVTRAGGISPPGLGDTEATAPAGSRSLPGPATFSSRYPSRCGGGGECSPDSERNPTWLPPAAHERFHGAPDARVRQVLVAPAASERTWIWLYRQRLDRQDCSAIASLLPSGDRATSSTAKGHTLMGRRPSRTVRPSGPTRSR